MDYITIRESELILNVIDIKDFKIICIGSMTSTN